MNMIIGKKQIILASLVVGLGLAVYINYQFAQSDGALTATSAIESDKNYGDAQLVDANDPTVEDIDGEAYFAEAKVTRQRSRDESVETLKNMLKATEIAKSIETEGKIENLIKAKGFEDCMVYYDTESVDVVVKTDGLQPEQVSQMKDIILKETSIPAENISIVEIN